MTLMTSCSINSGRILDSKNRSASSEAFDGSGRGGQADQQ